VGPYLRNAGEKTPRERGNEETGMMEYWNDGMMRTWFFTLIHLD
jgi:hypothetical protein